MRRLAAVGLVLAACSSGTVTPTTQPAATPAPQPSTIEVRLSEVEAMASRGAAIRVAGDVLLTEDAPSSRIDVAPGEVELTVTYLINGMAVEPRWTQVVVAEEGVTTEVVIEQPWRRLVPAADPIVLAWQTGGDIEAYLEQLEAAEGLTVTSPRWWTLDADGNLVGEADSAFVTEVHARGIKVWPYITNGFQAARTRLAIGDADRRRALANELSRAAEEAGVDGINVDFEAFSVHQRDDFSAFVSELTELVHSWGGVVSVDITAGVVPAAVLRLNRYDRRALAGSADYLALMAYDEHNRNRPSGPTASLGWTEDSLHWLLRHADPHQVLLGVPLYGRVWDPQDLNQPTTATIGTMVELAAANPGTVDADYGVDRVELPDGRYLWAEGYETLAARMELARRTGVAGTALWRLGFDTPEVWEIVAP